ncbi:MAG TPA: apolipoprotein N-acyltransferase [Mycobacteriales bacterium]|nr:apolipoprotein N-acyltransferase [Mycobacteriales bacterium]
MTRPFRLSALARPAAAVGAGIALWTTFPPLNWWPAAPAGVAVLALAVRARRLRAAAGLGLLAGFGIWVPTVSFLQPLGVDAWIAVSVIESLWFVGLGMALCLVGRLRWWPLAVGLMWVGEEFLRDRWPFGGFPWARLAFGQVDGPLVRLAALGGAPLVTFAVALAGGLLAYLVLELGPGGRRRLVPLAAATAAVGIVVAAPLAIGLPTAGTAQNGAPSSVVVAAIQGNVPRLGLEEFAQRHAVTQDHLDETRVLAQQVAAGQLPAPQIVIWPENASDLDPRTDPVARSQVDAAVAAVGVPTLIGAVIDGPGPNHVQNAGIVWSPATGPGEIYLKRHLVPFGEYLPFRGLLTRLVGEFSLIPKDFVPGRRRGTLQLGPARIADAICFEIADDAVVRQAVTGGGRLLVVQTNNASYEHPGDSGNGGETAQQLAITRLRAIESGRAAVVAATSGVSAMVAPDGKVIARTGVFTPAVLDMRLPLRDPLTIADRVGPWPEWILSLAALAALVLALLQYRGQRRANSLDLDSRVIDRPAAANASAASTQP